MSNSILENNGLYSVMLELMDSADTMNLIFEVHKVEDVLCYKIVYVNDSFCELIKITSERLYRIDLCQQELLKRVAFPVDFVNLDDIYNNKISSQGTTYISKFDLYLRVNAFIIKDKYICMEFVDVSDYELSKISNEKLLKEVSIAREKEKYHNELQMETSKKLEISKRIYKHISETSNDGFLYKNFVSGESRVSTKCKALFGYENSIISSYEEALRFIQNAMNDKDFKEYCRRKNDTIRKREASFELDFYVEHVKRWVRVSKHYYYDRNGDVFESISYYKDITDLVSHKEKLEYWAFYDNLTGLYNRNYFYELIDRKIERAKLEEKNIYLMYVDMDNFKKINDSLGFKYGDELILKISDTFKKFECDKINIARFNSDEFVFSIYGGSRYDVERIYDILKEYFSKPINLSNGVQLYVTFSIGVVTYPTHGINATELIGNADICMCKVKDNGKDGICYFEKDMRNSLIDNVMIENMLKQAIDEEKFELFYQPQYEVKSEKLRGFEALIRWNDETQGYISPGLFIPMAEKNGSIVKLGNWVLKKAFSDYKNILLKNGFDGILSINISGAQFKDTFFEDTVKELLEFYDIEPSRIEFEITETIFLGNKTYILPLIKRLREIGIKISLDDFGTGYSSLSYLKNIAIDTLKIDKSFVDTMISESKTDIITSSIVNMVQKLGLETIAEGVETEEQYEYLKRIDCNSIQGFLLGKPMNIESICQLLNNIK